MSDSRSGSEPNRPDDVGSGTGSSETEPEFAYNVSDSPPPVFEAYPEHDSGYEPPPAETRDSWSIPWPVTVAAIVASLVVVVLVIVIVVLAMNHGGSGQPSTAEPSTTVYQEPSFGTSSSMAPPPPVTVTSEETQTVTVTSSPIAPPAAPVPQSCDYTSVQQLRAQANIDRPVVTAWAEIRWVPQLSSKHPGTIDDGQVWNCSSIWGEHLQLRQQYDAKLLWSGDWPSTFKKPDYWVTIAGMAYPTSDGAQAWCDSHGKDSDHCFPTQIK